VTDPTVYAVDNISLRVEELLKVYQSICWLQLINSSFDLEVAGGKGKVVGYLDSHSELHFRLSLDILGDGVWNCGTFINVVVLFKWLAIDDDVDFESGTRRESDHVVVRLFVGNVFAWLCMRIPGTSEHNESFICPRTARSKQ
jgi:hypothetical protein